ncbi:hypothetical protein HPP92_029025 [Vanilla planifolia]|uniref:Uncharacterized protein n=1 Tax=Vanilla planifolia TaxID=51239 RepID=A0A835P568_VANPL|nr:hypothetical protein HPP92_029013 [Vanilla planifolia]KAG0446069.1 hypothetical protein HPP92_029025 [Vanilla planifolia]
MVTIWPVGLTWQVMPITAWATIENTIPAAHYGRLSFFAVLVATPSALFKSTGADEYGHSALLPLRCGLHWCHHAMLLL